MQNEEIPPHGSGLSTRQSLAVKLAIWLTGTIAAIVLAIFVLSFFLDGLVRSRLEAKMNQNLKGYSVTLNSAHLQLLGLRLTLKGLVLRQQAHPVPPVAEFPKLTFRIHWPALFSGHLVATVGFVHPRIHVDEPQFASEAHSDKSLRQRGWQDALQSAYPFKIDRLTVNEGDVVYLDQPGTKPLHLADLNFTTDNIRNIYYRDKVYPSRFRCRMIAFGVGHLHIEGRANYFDETFSRAHRALRLNRRTAGSS